MNIITTITDINSDGYGVGRTGEPPVADREYVCDTRNSSLAGLSCAFVGRANEPPRKVIFVPYTAVGDCVEVSVVKQTKSIIYGELVRVLSPSPDRIVLDCEYFGCGMSGGSVRCGGCDFRHISYEAELRAKANFIKNAFIRIGGFEPEFLPLIPSVSVDYYRNNVQFQVCKNKDGELIYGFYAPKSRTVVPHKNCKLYHREFAEIAEKALEKVRGRIPKQICVRKGHYSGEINAVADRQTPLIGARDITDTMCGLKVVISPNSFYQINTPTAEKLYAVIKEFVGGDSAQKAQVQPASELLQTAQTCSRSATTQKAQVQPASELLQTAQTCSRSVSGDPPVVLDVYCGIGTIGLSLSDVAKEVVGVECVRAAVKNAVVNAKLNNIKNARFICADACELPENIRPDVVILDPARKGCDFSVLEKVKNLKPSKIVMVSCSPATVARDCAILRQFGYEVTRVQGVDLFARTKHVECVVGLTVDS
ncbi:MAG: class I SAM-dependent RNA methyltransferase [Oscillospiraceae bacterium]|nr:class I SAM-dependent RNA methyltransferase [Oscillospiraceae bacterium]